MRLTLLQNMFATGSLLAAAVAPAAPPATLSPTGEASSRPALDGFWPTPKMMDSLLLRWADSAAEQFDLTPEQRGKLEAQLLEAWPPFLEANRTEILPLFNEYMEARLAMAPPSKEAVGAWAARGLPLYEKFKGEIGKANDRFASLLSGRQRLKFEVQRAKTALMLEGFHLRLQAWKKGEFTEMEWWDVPRVERDRRRTQAATAASQPADPFAEEMSAWDEFVQAFIERYHLDESQKKAAESILREMKSRAEGYHAARADEIAKLERTIASPPPEADPRKVEEELRTLYGPIDGMFKELERRLALIPTDRQKRAEDERVAPASAPDGP